MDNKQKSINENKKSNEVLSLNKNKFISLENIIRCFENGFDRKVFFNMELLINKDIALNNTVYLDIYIETKDSKHILLKRTISFTEQNVTFENSHQDPTVIIGNSYCFAVTIEKEDLKNYLIKQNIDEKNILSFGGQAYIFKDLEKIEVLSDKIIGEEIPWREIWSDKLFTRFVDNYQIEVLKDSVLTFHMNNKEAVYREETKNLKAGEIVDFYPYLKNNTYLGIQFSINEAYIGKDLDIEEKYVVKGQKGMFQSNLLILNEPTTNINMNSKAKLNIFYPNIVFNQIFLNKFTPLDEGFKEINKISELIKHYVEIKKSNKKAIKYFEMDVNYLIKNYKSLKTYAQSGVYSTNNKSRFFHIDQEICKFCDKNSKCVQNVPSNLSEQLYKKVIRIESKNECDLYKVL